MKIEEIKPRASEGDTIELEGKVAFAKKPNSKDFEGTTVWSQFIVLKDKTGEQGCWLKLDSEEEKVSKNSSIKVKGKVGEEYEDSKGKMKRSLNNCTFEGDTKGTASKSTQNNGNGKGDYWTKKLELDIKKAEWDKKVQFIIVRECAIKAVTELAKVNPDKGNFKIKVNTEKDFFEFADKIVAHIYKSSREAPVAKTEKEERIEEAKRIAGDTEFRPASTLQKNKIFGHRDEKGWHKGMIESRFITKAEIREIGSPDKLSVESASEWLSMWWGVGSDIGERARREIVARDQGKSEEPLVKGDKASLVKEVLVDDINAWRRENFLIDDDKFYEEMGYNPKLEELSEKDLLKLKELTKHYHPKSWNEEEK